MDEMKKITPDHVRGDGGSEKKELQGKLGCADKAQRYLIAFVSDL
jgi:hypothetical protein